MIPYNGAVYQYTPCPPAVSLCIQYLQCECVIPFCKLTVQLLTLLYRQARPAVEHTNGLLTHMQRQAHTWLPSGTISHCVLTALANLVTFQDRTRQLVRAYNLFSGCISPTACCGQQDYADPCATMLAVGS